MKSKKTLKKVRKYSRIIHRNLGFLFLFVSIIYGISGIAVNHQNDWNPNYSVKVQDFSTDLNFTKQNAKSQIDKLLKDLSIKAKYKAHYFPNNKTLKIYLSGNSNIIINTEQHEGRAEELRRRPIFYHANLLHFNPSRWWTWFADAYALSLIIFALTALFMVPGKKGAWGRGGIYIVIGIIIPILILIFI